MATRFDYGRSRATAGRLIAKFGQAGAVRRTEVTGGNPYDPSAGETTVTDHACTLVVTEYTLRERESSLIGATDKKVIISTAGLAIEPTAADELVIEGRAHAIARMEPLSPAGIVVTWQAQVAF